MLGSHSSSAFVGEYYRAWRPEITVPCSFCSAKGRSKCPVLDGIEEIPEPDAFKFAFARVGKKVLVDSSKDVDWAGSFANSGFDVKVIHVLRDPRGYFFSERRRLAVEFWPTLIDGWVEENTRIFESVRRFGIPFMPVFYDNLAKDPSLFSDIFRFLGLKPETSALSYWTKEHHGFAANGASSLLLRQFSERAYTTGDDSFYSSVGQRNFYDQRWIEGLSPEEKANIETNPAVIKLLAENGASMVEDGLRTEASTASAGRKRLAFFARWL